MSNSLPVEKPKRKRKRRTKRKAKYLPRYHVVLWNDNDHTFEYVIAMMRNLFAHSKEQGRRIALTVHRQGRAIVFTGHLELAELKRDQIHAYGADQLVDHCQGSMWATVEKAEE